MLHSIMTEVTTEVTTDSPTKAGIILYGMAADRQGTSRLHVLAPYSEGRFCARLKCYAPAKGSIDKGETPIQAAVRETLEETGVDIQELLGEEAYSRFLNGEVVTNIENTGYPGVKVIRANPTPIDHTYISGHEKQHRTHYFAIEVEGIEKLRPALKSLEKEQNSDAKAHDGEAVPVTAFEHVQKKELPNLREMLRILRAGNISKSWTAAQQRHETIIRSPAFPELATKYHFPAHHLTPSSWEQFCRRVEKDPDDYATLKRDVKAIKDHLEEVGLINDHKALKMDTSDRPLLFYQEGADILPVEEMLRRSAAVARVNPVYAKAMWGDGKGLSESQRMERAQIAPLVKFFAHKGIKVESPTTLSDSVAQHPNHYLRRVSRSRPWVQRVPTSADPVAARG